MRILKIRLKNINSLRGEHEIDFSASPLRESGLFGIVGATGSGKSTLLDSITLALFGRVPRIGPVTKGGLDKGGIILTKHEKDSYAEVAYECKQGVFTARWSVSKTKNGTFRDVEMKVFNEVRDQLSDGLKDAPAVNAANIGLDYDQFVKSILLCQGEFAKFLQSGKNERALLLEKITATHEFRRIGKKAFKEFNKRKGVLDTKIQVIGDLGRNLLTDELRAELEKEIETLAGKTGAAETKLDESKDKLGLKTRLKQLKEKLDEQKKRKEHAEQALREFEAKYGAVLQHYDKLFIHKHQLAEHTRLAAAVEDAKYKIGIYEQRIKGHDEEIGQMLVELRQWVGEEVSDHDYVQHLRAYRDKVRDLQSKCNENRNALTVCLGRLGPLLNMDAFQYERSVFREDSGNGLLLARLRSRKDNEAGKYRKLIDTHSFEEGKLQELRLFVADKITELGQLKLEVRGYMLQSSQIRLAAERIAGFESKLKEFDIASLRNELDVTNLAYAKAKEDRDRLLDAEKLEDLRKSLKEGEPCPLCGSEHHPYLHGFAEDVLKAGDDLAKWKQEYDRCKHAYDNGVLQVGQINNNLHNERQSLAEMEKENERIKALVGELKQKLGIDKVQSEDKVQELIDSQRNRLTALDECIRYKQWEPQSVQLEQAVDEYDALFAGLSEWKGVLARIYGGKDIDADCQAREAALQQRQGAKQEDAVKLKTAEDQRETDAKQLALLKEYLEGYLYSLGYPGIEEARGVLITEAEQKSLLEQRGKITQVILGSEEQLGLLRGQWEEAAQGDDASKTLDQQQLLVMEADAELKELRELSKEKFGSLQTDHKLREQLGGHIAEKNKLQDALKPWEMLNKLIGDATGNRFNNRAQELTLQHLLILANRRMDKLHSRYTLLMPEKLEDDDLRVEDGYMGNEIRTVRSLSGGETFVLSLALALGLSDLASRDIRIDSLFIDEGFGSLDPDALEEAMATLEQLQTESNKTVGIISHVESLKERIFTQIRLTKSNNGFSTLSIYPETGSTDEAEL
jgi:exonuclease SbcC